MPVDAPPPPAKLSTISSCRSNAYWLPSAIAVHLLHAMALFADGRRVDATPAAAGPDVVNGLRAADGALGALARDAVARSEERRVGKEWVSTCRSRWSRYH